MVSREWLLGKEPWHFVSISGGLSHAFIQCLSLRTLSHETQQRRIKLEVWHPVSLLNSVCSHMMLHTVYHWTSVNVLLFLPQANTQLIFAHTLAQAKTHKAYSCSLARSLACSITSSLTLAHSIARSLGRSLTRFFVRSLTSKLTHSMCQPSSKWR